jgi:hypothetical protein
LRSQFEIESAVAPGVKLGIWEVTLDRRIELTRQIHGLAVEQEYHAAAGSEAGRAAAALANLRAQAVVLRWGLASVSGLVVDGEEVTVSEFAERAPEALAREALEAIQKASGLTPGERKN